MGFYYELIFFFGRETFSKRRDIERLINILEEVGLNFSDDIKVGYFDETIREFVEKRFNELTESLLTEIRYPLYVGWMIAGGDLNVIRIYEDSFSIYGDGSSFLRWLRNVVNPQIIKKIWLKTLPRLTFFSPEYFLEYIPMEYSSLLELFREVYKIKNKIPFLTYFTILSKELVDKIGGEKITLSPAYYTEELDDGSIMIIMDKGIFEASDRAFARINYHILGKDFLNYLNENVRKYYERILKEEGLL